METKLQSKQQYPRFIQNKPCGIDKFDGGSQERLAKTIARHFCQNDSLDEECTLPRIIGIEGIWGSGKSNVVKMLERELSDDYYFFEYDAWGHQEDLQRRSILELLTSKLIDDGILSGNATIKVKGGGTKTVSWSEKLKYLLARKTETVTEKYPLISNGMVAAFLVAVLTPIFTFIAYAVKPTPTTWWFSLLSIIIAALPVLIALCVWKWAYSKDHKYGWSYMLAIYQDKVEKDVCYETLSEDEPTVYEFKTWMQDISDFIKEKGQRKLVLVFDNMDRLPAEKVKELWSSIHTFFADSGFENVWAVIPFDETHLACAFGDETDEQTKQLTKYFINKTFPIVYRVAPPVITDYRSIFNKLFVEAFGETENEAKETINRIFRLVNPNANVREIISYINEMVALKQEWCNEILMINIALFCLKKTDILANPVEQILSGDYLNGIQTIINNDLQTQREIAALVYGVDVEDARQIPLKKYIEGCINGEEDHDINQYAETNKQFDTVLEEVIQCMDNALIDKIIHCLHKLTRKSDVILRVWQRIAQLKLKESIEKQVFPVEYQELLLHLDTESQNHVIAQLYKKIVRFNDFNGGDYFKTLDAIDRFIAQNKLACDFTSLIEAKTVKPNTFIDYIQAANATDAAYRDNATTKAYKYYQVATNSEALDNYLANLLPDNFDHADIVKTLKDNSTYTFPTLLQAITNCIDEQNVNKDNIGAIFTTYRLLASDEERPLPVTLDSTYINQLHSELETDGRNIKESGDYAFYGCCEMTSVTIPNSVTTIGSSAFYRCSGLTRIDSYINHPAEVGMGSSIFYGVPTGTCELYVYEDTDPEYRSTAQWNDFNIIKHLPNFKLAFADNFQHIRGASDESYELVIELNNRMAFSAMQFCLRLPQFLILSTDEYGDYNAWLDADRKSRNHTLQIEPKGGNKYQVLISSPTNNTFKGTEGAVLHLVAKLTEIRHPEVGDFILTCSNIELAEADETQHITDVDSKASIFRLSYIVGDANADCSVDVADYVCTSNRILGRSNAIMVFDDAANANHDYTISVTDLVAITNIALEIRPVEIYPEWLSGTSMRAPAVLPPTDDYEVTAAVSPTPDGLTQVAIATDNARPIAAMQFDLTLPEGMTLVQTGVTDRSATLTTDSETTAPGKARVIVASFGTDEIAAGQGDVLTLTLQGQAKCGAVLSIDGVTMAERDLTTHRGNRLTLDISGTTGVDDTGRATRIYADDGKLVIDSAIGGSARLVCLDGRSVTLSVTAGHNVYTVPAGGIVIVTHNGIAKKLKL